MKYLINLLVLLISVVACEPSSSEQPNTNNSKDSMGLILPQPNDLSQQELNQFLALFPEVTSFEFNEALFTAYEGGGKNHIPIKQDLEILGTEHPNYNGAADFSPDIFNSAVAKFVIQPNEIWGLLVMKHVVGGDGRNQDYCIYTIDKAGEIINKKTVAVSRSWGGGFAQEEGHLGLDGDVYCVKSRAIRNDYGESEEKPYMAQAKLNEYRFLQNGRIEDNSQLAYLPPVEEEEAYAVKIFEGIELIEAPLEKAKEWQHYNEIEQRIGWVDKLGQNYVFFATESNEKNPELTFLGKPAAKTLHAIHYYTTAGKGLTTSWEMNDFEATCDFDLFTNFLYQSVELSDVNQDGLVEISFMYSLGCISDLSPVDVKLMLYENGAKYAVRGSSRIAYQIETGENTKPTYKVDKSFKKAPKGFQEFATTQWAKYDIVY